MNQSVVHHKQVEDSLLDIQTNFLHEISIGTVHRTLVDAIRECFLHNGPGSSNTEIT